MRERTAIIGGSGLYEMEGLTRLEETALITPFVATADAFLCGTLHEREGVFQPRHGRQHQDRKLRFRGQREQVCGQERQHVLL